MRNLNDKEGPSYSILLLPNDERAIVNQKIDLMGENKRLETHCHAQHNISPLPNEERAIVTQLIQ